MLEEFVRAAVTRLGAPTTEENKSQGYDKIEIRK